MKTTNEPMTANYPTLWKAVVYGLHAGRICRVCKWVSESRLAPPDSIQRYTLHPIDGSAPACGLLDGEFQAYTEQENALVRATLCQHKTEEYEPVWKD